MFWRLNNPCVIIIKNILFFWSSSRLPLPNDKTQKSFRRYTTGEFTWATDMTEWPRRSEDSTDCWTRTLKCGNLKHNIICNGQFWCFCVSDPGLSQRSAVWTLQWDIIKVFFSTDIDSSNNHEWQLNLWRDLGWKITEVSLKHQHVVNVLTILKTLLLTPHCSKPLENNRRKYTS